MSKEITAGGFRHMLLRTIAAQPMTLAELADAMERPERKRKRTRKKIHFNSDALCRDGFILRDQGWYVTTAAGLDKLQELDAYLEHRDRMRTAA